MRKKLIAAAALIACSAISYAQSLGFLNVNSDPSVAGPAVVAAPGAFSAENNIAATALSDKYFGVGFCYQAWQPSAATRNVINLGAYGCIGKRVGIGVSAKFFNAKAFNGTNDKGGFAGTYTPKENYFAVGVACRVFDGLAIGAKYKFITSDLWEKRKANAHAIDVSVMYKWQRLFAGVSVDNLGLGEGIDYGNGYVKLPSIIRVGASYKALEKGNHGITAALEGDYMFAGDIMADASVTYNFKKLETRLGFHYGNGVNAIPTHGSVGVGYEIVGIGINVKYLFASPTLANTVLIGLSYNF